MDLTLSAAAKALGKSKSTLSRVIKSGRVTARQDDAGVYHIDASELARVFGWNPDDAPQRRTEGPPEVPQERPSVPSAEAEVAVLRVKVEMLTALLDREREATTELRQLLMVLPHQVKAEAPAPAPGAKGFLARLLGR